MSLEVTKMTEKFAMDALCWKYEKPYHFYNNVLTSGALMELLTYRYFAVVNDTNQLVGYFCVGKPAQIPAKDKRKLYEEDCLDIGIGMKPELTGKGNGHAFFSCILTYLQKIDASKDFRLTVAAFNKRAIHLYKKFGFMEQKKFEKQQVEYVIMKRNRGE